MMRAMVRRGLALSLLFGGCLPSNYFDIQGTWTESTGGGESSGSGGEGSSSSSSGSTGSTGNGSASDSGGMASEGASSGSSGDEGSSGTTGAETTTGPVDACGDGELQEGEECDDANLDDGDGCTEHCFRERRVFVTSKTWSSNLGGIMGAVGICRQEAEKGGVPRFETFEPWLSDSQHDVLERMHRGKGPYLRMDGLEIAPNFEALLAKQLLAPIDVDEFGVKQGGTVWTGTRVDGTRVPMSGHCKDWHGIPDDPFSLEAWDGCATCADSNWTIHSQAIICGGMKRLYCFEGK
jgi:cysteine-rich repeat protein